MDELWAQTSIYAVILAIFRAKVTAFGGLWMSWVQQLVLMWFFDEYASLQLIFGINAC